MDLRDRYLIAKALKIAIDSIEAMPVEEQPFSDKCEMADLLVREFSEMTDAVGYDFNKNVVELR